MRLDPSVAIEPVERIPRGVRPEQSIQEALPGLIPWRQAGSLQRPQDVRRGVPVRLHGNVLNGSVAR